eukprot:2278105-Rhodomonas_salina.5
MNGSSACINGGSASINGGRPAALAVEDGGDRVHGTPLRDALSEYRAEHTQQPDPYAISAPRTTQHTFPYAI